MDDDKNTVNLTPETVSQEPEKHTVDQKPESPVHIKHAHKFIYVYLALTTLAALAGAGTYWYHKNHKAAPTTTNNSSKKASASVTNYFTIKDWGVRVPYNGKDNLTYQVDPYNSNNAWLNSNQLATADSNCKISPNTGNAGYVGRYLPTDSIPTTDGSVGMSVQNFISQDFGALKSTPPAYTKVGNYYYIYWTGAIGCDTNPSSNTIYNQTTAEFGNLVKKLQAIPTGVSVADSSTAFVKPLFELPSGWAWYTNSQAGFKFAYPTSWGNPRYSVTQGTTGSDYTLNFYPGPPYSDADFATNMPALSRNTIMVRFSSDDYSEPGYKGGTIGPVLTKTDVEKFVSTYKAPKYMGNNSTLVYADQESYSELLDNRNPGETNILAADGIVSIPNLKISAANISYQILNRPANCTLNALSPNGTQWCATFELNDELISVLNSFASD